MKKVLNVLAIIAIVVCFNTVEAQVKSPKGNAQITKNGVEVSIDYSRPYKKGRKIFGGLVPYNKYWRTGANLATEISFSKDVIFKDKKVKAGRYRFYTIPGEDSWKVVLNSELNKKGFYEPNHDLDVLTVEVKPKPMKKELEQFTIQLKETKKGVIAVLKWDTTKVSIPIKIK
jgi:copper chaperone CopZ